MADQPQPGTDDAQPDNAQHNNDDVSIVELFEYVKTYARQETLGPLRGAGRWLALGTAAAVVLGLGLTLMMLGLLRLLQTEWERSATGRLSWLSYLIVFVVVVALLLLTVTRISKKSLNKESY
ncbi:MAG TPA: hypothetical protein VFV63_16565 [Ilumatobacteraceae bacterium]|nr:hypothetical protein [Ilumatobacteraceae bacterium]